MSRLPVLKYRGERFTSRHIVEWLGRVLGTIIAHAIIAFPFMFLWNHALPEIFPVPMIHWNNAFFLLLLAQFSYYWIKE